MLELPQSSVLKVFNEDSTTI